MTTEEGNTVSMVAPATLNEGYTFDVTVDGKTIAVVVPPGGVKEGKPTRMVIQFDIMHSALYLN